MRRWIRTRPERRDTAGALMAAGVVAAAAGAVTYYFSKLFLAREELGAPSVPLGSRPNRPGIVVEAGPRGPEALPDSQAPRALRDQAVRSPKT